MTDEKNDPTLLQQLELVSTGNPYLLNTPAAAFVEKGGLKIDDVVKLQIAVVRNPVIQKRFFEALTQCISFSGSHKTFLTPEQLANVMHNICICIPYSHLMQTLKVPQDRAVINGIMTNFLTSLSPVWGCDISSDIIPILLDDIEAGIDRSPPENASDIAILCEIGWHLANVALTTPGAPGTAIRAKTLNWSIQLLTREDKTYASVTAGMLQRAFGIKLIH
jgi:hypothetical protein